MPTVTAVKLPLAHPSPRFKPKQVRAVLTSSQQQKYDRVLSQVKGWKEVSSAKGNAGPLTHGEQMWLTRECLLRYLRATKWDENECDRRLRETISWRRDFGVDDLGADLLSHENETGKQVILGFDNDGRVCHYLRPGQQNTPASPRNVQHLVFMLERVLDLMPAGQETLALLIDMKGNKSNSNTAPGLGIAREVLHILQHHYPERLGRAIINNIHWLVSGFFKLMTPLIDPRTREKIYFNEDMRKHIPTEQLWTEFNGSLEFEYDHAVYWPALNTLCAERREARTKRWIAGGRQIGEYEDYLAGATESGVRP